MTLPIWKVTLTYGYGCGGNPNIKISAPDQTTALKLAEKQTGMKAIRATR